MKGRNGELGDSSVAWDFAGILLDLVDPVPRRDGFDDIWEE